ncbi:MAG TPA: hypothetical protein VFF06_31635 [Polyangia bacterium]|nr:hypothetical protein [Polyangia bacterium]
MPMKWSPWWLAVALAASASTARADDDYGYECDPPAVADISIFVAGTNDRIAEFNIRGRSVQGRGRESAAPGVEASIEYKVEYVYCYGRPATSMQLRRNEGDSDRTFINFGPDGLPTGAFGGDYNAKLAYGREAVDVRGVWDGRRFAHRAAAKPAPAPAPPSAASAASALSVAEAHHQELRDLFKQATPQTAVSAETARLKKACLAGDPVACSRVGQPKPPDKPLDICTDCLTQRTACLQACPPSPGIGDLARECGPEEGADQRWSQTRAELRASVARAQRRNECVDRARALPKKCRGSCGKCPPACNAVQSAQ